MRDEAGAVLADEHVGHRFTFEHSLIQAMEVCPLPSSTQKLNHDLQRTGKSSGLRGLIAIGKTKFPCLGLVAFAASSEYRIYLTGVATITDALPLKTP